MLPIKTKADFDSAFEQLKVIDEQIIRVCAIGHEMNLLGYEAAQEDLGDLVTRLKLQRDAVELEICKYQDERIQTAAEDNIEELYRVLPVMPNNDPQRSKLQTDGFPGEAGVMILHLGPNAQPDVIDELRARFQAEAPTEDETSIN